MGARRIQVEIRDERHTVFIHGGASWKKRMGGQGEGRGRSQYNLATEEGLGSIGDEGERYPYCPASKGTRSESRLSRVRRVKTDRRLFLADLLCARAWDGSAMGTGRTVQSEVQSVHACKLEPPGTVGPKPPPRCLALGPPGGTSRTQNALDSNRDWIGRLP